MADTGYTYRKNLSGKSFEQALAAVTTALAEEGFGVLSEIDAQATLKNKLGVEFRPYKILGACNPGLAHKALQIAPEIGALLPCNVVVQEFDGSVAVDIADPKAMFAITKRAELEEVANEADARLRRVLAKLH